MNALAPHLSLIVLTLNLMGVAVFAASGALTASRKEMDVVGFAFVAIVTGLGGGSLRDMLLGATPVFWIAEPLYVLICVVMAALIFFTAHLLESRYRALVWADAAGMAMFAVVGAHLALKAGASPGVAILLGVVTATFGGILRDVLCDETLLFLRREIYASAAAAGAATYVGLSALGVATLYAAPCAFVIAFAIRAAGITWRLSLPPYRPRPGRPYSEPSPQEKAPLD
jgi:uncharacterized membrane protein YeiH